MRNLFLYITVFSFAFMTAQEKTVHTSTTDTKLTSIPYYTYGNGLGITSSDSLYQVNFRFRMQNRLTYFQNEGEAGTYEGQVKRLRLRLDGYVLNPKFLYVIQFGFSPSDIGKVENGSQINVIRDAMLIYRPTKHWNFGFGQTTLPGNRQRINSAGALQFTDRSINDARFTIESDFGFHFANLNQFSDQFSYNFKAAISTGEGRTYSSSPDKGVALTGRVELFPFGAFKKNGAFFEGDLMREEALKMMVSASFSQNNKAQKSQGQLGKQLFDSRNLKSLMLDGIVKYQGWSAMAAYMSRTTDESPLTFNPLDITDIRYVYAGSGQDYQLSYNFPSNYELAGRYSIQNVAADIFQFTPDRKEYSIGITRYIWEHAFKLQGEVSLDELRFIDGSQKQNWYLRFQVEIGL